MRHRIAAAATAALIASGPAAAQIWERFERPDYRFAIEVPDSLFDIREKGGDRDRVTWRTRSGDIVLEAFSLPVGMAVSPARILALRQESFPERVITYEASKEGWAVVSGYETAARDRIFYERFESAQRSAYWAGFVLRWNVTRRADVDDTVKRIGQSLTVTR